MRILAGAIGEIMFSAGTVMLAANIVSSYVKVSRLKLGAAIAAVVVLMCLMLDVEFVSFGRLAAAALSGT